jgi:hypothetical protein
MRFVIAVGYRDLLGRSARLWQLPALYRQLMALTWFSTVADAAGK